MKTYFILLSAAICASFLSKAQIILSPKNSSNVTDLINTIVGPGVQVANATLNCGTTRSSAGVYSTNESILDMNGGVFPQGGIVLSTGSLQTTTTGPIVYGINSAATNTSKGRFNEKVTDAELAILAGTFGTKIFDKCELSFDVTPTGNQLSLQYKFASDEYPLYNCTDYTDICRVSLKQGTTVVPVNNFITSTANPSDLVAVNNINNGALVFGKKYKCDAINNNAISLNQGIYVDNGANSNLVYNGVTQTLLASAAVQACSTYRMTLKIADLGDDDRDSGLFIKGGGLTSTGLSLSASTTSMYALNAATATQLVEGCNIVTITATANVASSTAQVYTIKVNDATGNLSNDLVGGSTKTITMPAGATVTTFTIQAASDNVGEGIEALNLNLYGASCPNIVMAVLPISVIDPISASFTSSSTTICTGTSCTLAAASSTNGITYNTSLVSYSWQSPITTNTTSPTVVVSPSTTTTYNCTMTLGTCAPVLASGVVSLTAQPSFNATITNNSVCAGDNISLSASTSCTNCAITWQPGNLANNTTIAAVNTNAVVATTIYTATVADGACTTSATKSVEIKPQINITINNKKDIDCISKGSFTLITQSTNTVVISPTITATTTSTANGELTNLYSGLNNGIYTITVTNSFNCISSSTVSIGGSGGPISLTASVSGLCLGQTQGNIVATCAGGIAPYKFIVNNKIVSQGSANSWSTANAVFGNYSFQVMDANNCTATTFYYLPQENNNWFGNVNLIYPSVCSGNNYSISIGGNSNYSYAVSPSCSQSSSGTNTIYATPNAGVYTITATANGNGNSCTQTYLVDIKSTIPLSLPNTCGVNNFVNVLNANNANVNYTITPPVSVGQTNQSNYIFSNLVPNATYTITAFSSGAVCNSVIFSTTPNTNQLNNFTISAGSTALLSNVEFTNFDPNCVFILKQITSSNNNISSLFIPNTITPANNTIKIQNLVKGSYILQSYIPYSPFCITDYPFIIP